MSDSNERTDDELQPSAKLWVRWAILGFFGTMYLFYLIGENRRSLDRILQDLGFCVIIFWYLFGLTMSVRAGFKRHQHVFAAIMCNVFLGALPVFLALIGLFIARPGAHM